MSNEITQQTFRMPRGLPRPLQDGMPVPFTSDHYVSSGEVSFSVAALNQNRSRECIRKRLCMLCGDQLTERSAVIAVYSDDSGGGNHNWDTPARTPQNRGVLEDGAFHERCAKMAMRHCPHLRDDTGKQLPEIWVGKTAGFAANGRVPKGWRRLKTTAQRRAARQTVAVA